MWTAILLLGAASAADLLPWVAPWDVQEQYDLWKKTRNEAPRPLACEPLWEGSARLCLRSETDGRLRRLHRDEAVLDRSALIRGAAEWIGEELEEAPVQGMPATYRMLRDTRGRAALGILVPTALQADLGTPFLAAMPSSGVFVAWKGGEPELDRVMAVAVREMHDAAKDRVSPAVWGWDGKRWFPFAEAKPVQDESPEK